MHSLEAAVVIVAYLTMYLLGYGGDTPVWCLVFGVLGALQQQPAVQRRLAGGDLTRRANLRMALLMLTGAAFVYGTGWGSVMLCGLALVAALQMRLSGPGVWRSGVLWTILCAIGGEAATALGWAGTYLPGHSAPVIAIGVTALCVLLTRNVGIAGEQRERAEAAAIAAERRFRIMIQESADMIAVWDRGGALSYVSPAVRGLVGLEPDEADSATLLARVHPDDRWLIRPEPDALAPPFRQIEFRLLSPDGSYRWAEARVRDLTTDPEIVGHLANLRDIHDRKTSQQRLAYAASHDQLTGLRNRAAFGRALDDACAAGETAVLFVDLDGFKQVNDHHGHDAGDALLIAAARVLRDNAGEEASVGRFGGDEFGVVLPGDDELARRTAERIVAAMREPVLFEGRELTLRCSIGVALSPGGAGDLLRRADLAMYAAKRAGTHSYEVAAPVAA
ncbi:diguanylate cyclase [Actinoplanes sp. NPDC023936]|uniref:diguanylate cyclase domain-containing protein n=1 Tax=Actinoplanes sp. NPDC023936 TaxID=3154910 RepID=UPI0033FD7E98